MMCDGAERWTYGEFADRCLRQAGMLADLGLQPGDRVAVLAPNTHVMLESHYGVLYAGMVLVALNTRLSAAELRYVVGQSRLPPPDRRCGSRRTGRGGHRR